MTYADAATIQAVVDKVKAEIEELDKRVKALETKTTDSTSE